MKPELLRFGTGGSPVVVIDGFSGAVDEVVGLAAALSPFPSYRTSYYPGPRRTIGEGDRDAYAYVVRTLETAAPFIGGAFDIDRFDLLQASFSMVTTPPEALAPPQRAPHFDSVDPRYIAVLHYLSDTPGTGTAFYRQRSTGIERVDEGNLQAFVAAAKAAGGASGYIQGSDAHYEQIGAVEAVPDRLVIYQGCLLHSGIIPPDMVLSADPRRGRLTANIFVQGRKERPQ
ncbi:MAG TPA: DUF6445 family protein [Allosphingosinicella sp.]|jgi:hypothetical protein